MEKRLFSATVAAVCSLFIVSSQVAGQKVRLRSQITPTCSEVRSGAGAGIRFSDLFGDGNIAVQGSYNCNGVFIYDISNPDAPTLASWYDPGNNLQFLEAIVIGNRGYFGSGLGGGGVHIVDLSDPHSPVLLGTIDSSHGNGHDYIHEMFVLDQDGKRYLIENYNSTAVKPLKILDITDPAQPVLKWEFSPTNNGWVHNMHIRGNRMYTSQWSGTRVEMYDISNLAGKPPTYINAIDSNSNHHSSWTSEDGNYLYSARETFDGDLRVYDVHDPAQPLLVRSIKAADLGLNAITPHNPVVMGNKLYVAWYQAGLQVFDISIPANPVRIGQYDTFPYQFAPTQSEIAALQNQDQWDMYCGGTNLQNTLPSNYDGAWAVYPFLGESKILVGDVRSGLLILDVTKVAQPPKNVVSDFDGDGKTDLSVVTAQSGQWTIEQSSDSVPLGVHWGVVDDIPAAGDYDGDGRSDLAVFRPSSGVWWILFSSSGTWSGVQFGLAQDVPVAADYDSDGRTDIAVWRPANGTWYMLRSTLGFGAVQWGFNGDKPLVGDFEGDGKPDIAVWRPANGVWYILPSSSLIPMYFSWGANGDKPVWADYDGDGKSDYSIYRPSAGTWWIYLSTTNSYFAYPFGVTEDIPIPADYDGDGKADIAVFRPSESVWYRVDSSTGSFYARSFGQPNDIASPASVQPR